MKTLDSLFSSSGVGKQDSGIRAGLELIRQWKDERAPLEELGTAIAITAFAGAKEMVPRLNFSTEAEKNEQFFGCNASLFISSFILSIGWP